MASCILVEVKGQTMQSPRTGPITSIPLTQIQTNGPISLPCKSAGQLFSLKTLDGKIYAVAAKNTQGSLASVGCYDLESSVWPYVPHTCNGLFGHVGTSFCGMLFTSGGVVVGRHFTYSLQRYNLKIEKWIHMSPMTHKEAFRAMCTAREKLHVTGGEHVRSVRKTV